MKFRTLFFILALIASPSWAASTATQTIPGTYGSAGSFVPATSSAPLPVSVYDLGNHSGYCYTSNGSSSPATFQVCGGGGGSGTVTSVGIATANGVTPTGSPVTTSGTITLVPTAGGTFASSANNLGFFASTTSAQLAGVISDETGTGSAVFGTAPTISGGNLTGTTSIGTANLSGPETITSSSATCFTAGPSGATTPAFTVNCSSAVGTTVVVTGGAGTAAPVISVSGTTMGLTINSGANLLLNSTGSGSTIIGSSLESDFFSQLKTAGLDVFEFGGVTQAEFSNTQNYFLQSVAIGTTTPLTTLDVRGATSTNQLIGNSGNPTIAVGAAAGTGASATISGTTISGVINVTSGTSTTASAILATITLNGTLAATPKQCSLTPQNANAVGQALMVYPGVPSTTSNVTTFTINVAGSAVPASTNSFQWGYSCF